MIVYNRVRRSRRLNTLAFIILVVLANYALALSAIGPPDDDFSIRVDQQGRQLLITKRLGRTSVETWPPQAHPQAQLEGLVNWSPPVTKIDIQRLPHWSTGVDYYYAELYGYPFRFLSHSAWADENAGVDASSGIDIGPPGMTIPTDVLELRLFYNVIAWMAAATAVFVAYAVGVPATVRLVRRYRGRCPSCAYLLHHSVSARCSECGTDLVDRDSNLMGK